ncbi:MAG: sensor domain-containing protein [Lysobacter sp.]
MRRERPAQRPSTPPDAAADAAATLAALESACARTDLPAQTQALLEQARAALEQAHADQRYAQARYRALFDAVPDPVSIIAWDGTVLDLNKAGMAAYQRPREAIIGQPIEVLNPDLPAGHMGPVRDALSRGDSYVIEVTNMRADGTRFPVEVHSANFEHEGQPCLVAVARDLSGRVEAELRYRELTEMVDKGVIVRADDGRILYANAAATGLLDAEVGATLEDVLRSGDWLAVDEGGRVLREPELPSFQALSSGHGASGQVIGFYNKRRRRLTWLSVTSVPQFAAGADRPHQVLSVFNDITELKRDSAMFERAQALAHVGGWEWDTSHDQLYLTAEAKRILGRNPPPDTIEGLLDGLVEHDRQRFRHALDRAMTTSCGIELELRGVRGDGRPFWVRAIGEADAGSPLSARLVGTLQDITDRKQAEDSLRVQARTDPLTGLLNRDAVRTEIESRLADPGQARLAVLYIDLDRFKIVNDVLGHAAGDRLLASAARRIRRAVGGEGVIARFGGDEFLVVCATADDPSRAPRLADAILDIFGDSFRLDGEEFAITASIGIAQAPDDGHRSQQLIQSADVAMYDSKRRGRNGWQVFTAELAAQQAERLQLETQLRRAVSNNELHLVYQPQVDLVSGRLIAAEALVRWKNPALGDMQPSHFIDHAESTGDIVGIGDWVLTRACRQLREWRRQGLPIERVAVNVSYRQFIGEDLAAHVRAALKESGLPGSALELEFTERVLIEDEPDTLRTFATLRDLGVVLTIDDFGEGYSALNYLRRLPIHGLKLSQLFVQGVPDNASDVAVCQAVTGIARSLGLGLVAEGIETVAQRDYLVGLGVGVGQGYLFSAGLTPEEMQRRYL